MKRLALTLCLAATPAASGGYLEPILSPEVLRPEPRPVECDRFLFWLICDPENPSRRVGGEGGGDPRKLAGERPLPDPGDQPTPEPEPGPSEPPTKEDPDEEERPTPPAPEPEPEPSPDPDPEPGPDRPKGPPGVVKPDHPKHHKHKHKKEKHRD